MSEIYTILEAADAEGRPTGRFHHVSYSDEAPKGQRIYHRLTDKEYASREEAEACPEARDKLDRIFMRGKYGSGARLRAEDWENACHELIWKTDPALFDRIRERAEVERQSRVAAIRPE